MGTLTRNKYIDVTVRYYNKDWHQVWYNGKAAYIYRTNVTLSSGTNTAVKASSAALKKTASSKASTLATLQKGAVFKRYYYTGSYMYVNYNGTTGYINKSALKGTSSSSTGSTYGYVTGSTVKIKEQGFYFKLRHCHSQKGRQTRGLKEKLQLELAPGSL